MQRAFTKMHGCGNDYIYFDCLAESLPDPSPIAVRLSRRHFSVGGDGIVLIEPSQNADAFMRMYNADGSQGKMCGNAIHCVGKYLYDHGLLSHPACDIETLSGIKHLELTVENGRAVAAQVDMGPAELDPQRIPVRLPGDKVVCRQTQVAGDKYVITCVSMGNPHCVVFTEDVESLDLAALGPRFECDPIFPERVNTEFVQVLGVNHLRMRVWERGSGETWACGTGACASAVAACLTGRCATGEDIRVELIGGVLTIRYTGKTVYMTGPAETAFEGVVEL